MKGILLAAAMVMLPMAGNIQGATTKIIDGTCDESSHVAEGPIGADLSSRHARYFCDTLVMWRIGAGKILMQFTEKGAAHGRILGFGGQMDSPATTLVDHVYFQSGTPTDANEGVCKFFFNDSQKVTSVMCAAKVDEGGRRTVPVVVFKARSAF